MPVITRYGPYRVRVTSDPNEDPDPQSRVRRGRVKERRVPRFAWIAGGIVLVLALWAATSIGERPELGRGSETTQSARSTDPITTQVDVIHGEGGPGGDVTNSPPDDAGTRFTENAPVLPSAGCATTNPESITSDAGLTVDGSLLARYSVTTPSDEGPAPLLVLVGEPGLPSAELARQSALFDVNPGWVHIGVDPLVSPQELGRLGIPELLEETITTQCVDLHRVFVVGFGEGGHSVGEAVCSAPQRMTGAAMVAGWTEPTCSPDPRVSLRIVGSDDDPDSDTGTALEEVGGAWAEAMETGEQVVDGRDEETLVRRWRGPGGVTVETTATVTGGHAWTVSASLALGEFLENTARSLG